MAKKVASERWLERWEVEWQELTEAAKKRKQAEADGGELYEHDIDQDEVNVCKVFLLYEKAFAYAKKIVDSHVTVYGHATIIKQRLTLVEGTHLKEWENVTEPEYID